jgi:hypothetical protein
MPATGSGGNDGNAMGLEVDVVDPTRAVSLSICIRTTSVTVLIMHLHEPLIGELWSLRGPLLQAQKWQCKPTHHAKTPLVEGWGRVHGMLHVLMVSLQGGERVLGRARQGGGPRRASDSDSDSDSSADDADIGAAARAYAASQVVYTHPMCAHCANSKSARLCMSLHSCRLATPPGDACDMQPRNNLARKCWLSEHFGPRIGRSRGLCRCLLPGRLHLGLRGGAHPGG